MVQDSRVKCLQIRGAKLVSPMVTCAQICLSYKTHTEDVTEKMGGKKPEQRELTPQTS